MGIFEKFKIGFKKSASTFTSGLKDIIIKKEIDDKTLNEVEDYLIESDVGVVAASEIKEIISSEKIDPKKDTLNEVNIILKKYIIELMKPLEKINFFNKNEGLKILLISGVNGVGKTTTIGKIGKILKSHNNKILFSASDTFRAAAVEQLKVWGDRSNVDVISNQSKNADPAAVVFDAINSAKKRNVDLLLVDTAGRLQTKNNLMDELAKIKKIIDKKVPDAIVESLLVLDASQGQNGLKQAKSFAKSADLSGAIITKLDGTSRGGVSLAVSEEVNLPIRFIGAGEGIKDLRPFNSYEFVEALLADK